MTESKGIETYHNIVIAAMMKGFQQLITRVFVPGKTPVEVIEHKDLSGNDKKQH